MTVHLPPRPPEPEDRRWLGELRQYVHREVSQWLEDEVRGGPLLRLSKQELSEAVGRRRPVLVSARSEDRLLDPRETLAEVFVEDAGRSLLILGAPGAGKSVLLRQLARDLLRRAEADPREPVPVLLDLSNWTDDGRVFTDWLASADGLRRGYRNYSEADLRTWLHKRRLCLLLDGLDEVRPEHCAGCVAAINAFVAGEDGGRSGGLAVCCRLDDYQALAVRGAHLRLGAAVYLQPLTEGQVEQYLEAGGAPLEKLRAAWREDPEVQELARNPLMLSTMRFAFEHLGSVPKQNRLEGLLDAFVARLFERAEERFGRREHEAALPLPEEDVSQWASGTGRRMGPLRGGEALPYEQAQTVRRLGWLAERLLEHARSTFYVEEVQPSWLPAGRPRVGYAILSRCTGGLLLGFTAGSLLLLGLGVSGTLFGVAEALVTAGIVLALSTAGALAASAVAARRFAAPSGPAQGRRATAPRRRFPALAALLGGMSVLGGLFFAVGGWRWEYGLVFGLVWGAVSIVVFDPMAAWRTAARDVRLVEPLRWSWRSALGAVWYGIKAGALVGAAGGALWLWMGELQSLRTALVVVTAAGTAAVAAVIGGALGGLQQRSVEEHRPRPNLGLRLSLRNAALAGAVVALAGTVVLSALGFVFTAGAFRMATSVRWGVSGGLFFGLLAALRYGGLNAVYHFTLRLLLARAGRFPFNAAAFLDFTADLSLMRRAGAGYAFSHRLLAEYFAQRRRYHAEHYGEQGTENGGSEHYGA